MIRKLVGARLKLLRIKKGMSQERFALDIGLDRTYIASVESGKRNISIINLEKICKGLGVSEKEFFDDESFQTKRHD